MALGFGLAACASGLVATSAGFEDPRFGYAIGRPPGPDGYWRRVELEDAELAFRGGGGETLSLAVHCGRSVAAPRVMARHLRFGLPPHRVVREEATQVAGAPGWLQVIEVPQPGGEPVRIESVTAVRDGCTFDWLLAVRGALAPAQARFEAWRESFRWGRGAGSSTGRLPSDRAREKR